MTTQNLGKELRTIRKMKRSSLRDVEKATNISNAYLSQLERGEASNPSPNILYKLAEYYSVPYESFMVSAGYLKKNSKTSLEESNKPKRPSAIQAALLSEDLNDEENKLVANYIKFLRAQRK